MTLRISRNTLRAGLITAVLGSVVAAPAAGAFAASAAPAQDRPAQVRTLADCKPQPKKSRPVVKYLENGAKAVITKNRDGSYTARISEKGRPVGVMGKGRTVLSTERGTYTFHPYTGQIICQPKKTAGNSAPTGADEDAKPQPQPVDPEPEQQDGDLS
ncbi:hypothetical protein G5C51_33895 [Streptomyces sp. A7024]|uniref:Secreted protein n=1 Tax=Streptomyces coryli TaxID=1128680 RepID=A0A6G4U9S1_9ACTN|nr:hypothetical protein [Streptomyces coryli]NGN68873.1 hypothetical protein [Streptomyces coryli]